MDSVENMQDFNIPSIEQDVSAVVEELSPVAVDSSASSLEENKSETPPEAQETDNEALSSLLMLSKSNTDPGSKTFSGEATGSGETDPAKVIAPPKIAPKRALPSTERAARGDNQPLSKSVKMEDLRKFFHLPIVEVARQLGTCTTALKKICRKNKIQKWPYRQIRSITKSIQSLEMASLNDTLPEDLRIQYRQQIVTLQNAIDDLIKDPNGVIQLVNMGLSEEALQHLRDSGDLAQDDDFDLPVTSSATVSGSASKHTLYSSHASQGSSSIATHPSSAHTMSYAKNYGLTSSSKSNGGAQGVLNLLQWPKPSADVQQIMQAAAQLTTQTDTQAAVRRTAKVKRKSSEAGLDGIDDGAGGGGSSSGVSGTSGVNSTGSGGSGVHEDTIPGGEKQHVEGLDVSQLEGGNLRHRKVEIGDTVADCVFVPDSQKMVFTGPVHLAPLQRKKLKPNITRKVVPLMEPDIGSNFGIEFIPQFILNILHSAIGSSNVMTDAHRQMLQQQALAQQAQVQAQHLYDASIESIDESIHNYINDSASYPPVYGGGMYGSGNSSSTDLDMYAAQAYNTNLANNNMNVNTFNTTIDNTNHNSASNTTYSHYTHEPTATQAAAHLVSLTNTPP